MDGRDVEALLGLQREHTASDGADNAKTGV